MVFSNIRSVLAMLALSLFSGVAIAQKFGGDRLSRRDLSAADVQNFLKTLQSMRQFTVMQALVERTGVADTIQQSNRNATIFVPTDFAFRRLSKDSLQQIGEQSKENRQNIIEYHVLPDQVLTLEQLLSSTPKEYTMLSGETATVDERELNVPLRNLVSKETLQKIQSKARGGTLEVELLQINNATIVMADIPFSNGIIHAIDRVLIPPSLAAESNATQA